VCVPLERSVSSLLERTLLLKVFDFAIESISSSWVFIPAPGAASTETLSVSETVAVRKSLGSFPSGNAKESISSLSFVTFGMA